MTKKSLTVKLIVLILLFVVVAAACGFCVSVINGTWDGVFPRFSFGTDTGNTALVLTKQFDCADIDALRITTASADIRVTTGGDMIEVKYYSNDEREKEEPRLAVEERSKELSLTVKTRSFFTFLSSNSYIEVRVPEQYLAAYNLKTASGDIAFAAAATDCSLITVSGEISCTAECDGTVSLLSTSGDIHCAANAPKIDLKTTSGDLVSTVPAKELYAKSVSGEISVAADPDSTSVETDTVSGDTRISLNDVTGYTVKFSTVSGDLSDRSNGRDSENDTNYSVGDGSLSVSAKSVSGDLRID